MIFSTLISFLIPFFKVGIWSKEVINVVENTAYTQQEITPNVTMIQHPQIVESAFTLNSFIFTAYLVVTLLFIFRLTKGFIYIMKIKGLNEYGMKNGIIIIHLEKSNAAFSFFNLLFIDPELENQSTIRKHEMAHIKQGHSFDILFYELIGAINWFNPVVYLLKKDIKLIHEYLADLEVTDSEMKKYDYAMFLIKRSINLQNLTLTNQIFNSSLLKKRIFMLNQNKTAGWVKLKMLFVLPIICGMLGLSTMAFTKTYGVLDLYSNAIIKQDTIKSNSIIEGLMIREEGTKINLYFRYNDLLKKGMPVSKKLFVVNGKLIEPGSFGGIENADYFIELNS
ncbi:MAG: M56 family metallopeptidase, partial [Pedobacter sp.]